jgi:hypothetical protein
MEQAQKLLLRFQITTHIVNLFESPLLHLGGQLGQMWKKAMARGRLFQEYILDRQA